MFFFRLFIFCSARVSGSVIVLSDNPCERIGKWETWSDFERCQIINARLAGAPVTKPASLLGVSKTTVSLETGYLFETKLVMVHIVFMITEVCANSKLLSISAVICRLTHCQTISIYSFVKRLFVAVEALLLVERHF
jgi:hypothetical protein